MLVYQRVLIVLLIIVNQQTWSLDLTISKSKKHEDLLIINWLVFGFNNKLLYTGDLLTKKDADFASKCEHLYVCILYPYEII